MLKYYDIINIYINNLLEYIDKSLVYLGYNSIISSAKVNSINKNEEIYTIDISIIYPYNLFDIFNNLNLLNEFQNNIIQLFIKFNPNIPVTINIVNNKIILVMDLYKNINLDDLPHDVIKMMIYNWTYNEIINICHTNKILSLICNDESFWNLRLLKDLSKDDIIQIWKGSYKKTFKFYSNIMNSNYATIHNIIYIITPALIDIKSIDFLINSYRIIIPLIRNGDLIKLNTFNKYIIKIIHKTNNYIEILNLDSTNNPGKNFPYPQFKFDYWDYNNMNKIGFDSNSDQWIYENPKLYFNSKNVIDLEYYGYLISYSSKYGNKNRSIYAKFKYNDELYIIFINNPDLNKINKIKKNSLISRSDSFDVVSDINQLTEFQFSIIQKYNIKYKNYAKSVN